MFIAANLCLVLMKITARVLLHSRAISTGGVLQTRREADKSLLSPRTARSRAPYQRRDYTFSRGRTAARFAFLSRTTR